MCTMITGFVCDVVQCIKLLPQVTVGKDSDFVCGSLDNEKLQLLESIV